MKDKFGHLQEENDDKENSAEEELRGGEPRSREDQYSEEFQEAEQEVQENIQEATDTDREREIRRDTDIEDREVQSGIREVDWAITYEFNENFDFHVKQNEQRVKVPVIWDNQERWTWARQRRNLKTVKDKVLLPLIVIDRSDVSEHPSHRTKPTITQLNKTGRTLSVRQRYSKRNRYDQFSVLNDGQPEVEHYVTQVPNFFQASYDVTIYTEYRWQMDGINDQIDYHSDIYWGDDETGRLFYTRVDSRSTEVEMSDEARYVQSNITLSVDGYTVPEEVQDDPGIEKHTTPSKIKFSEQVEGRL